jgi:hypothetical protein
MSIYATQWQLKFPRDGFDWPGCEWVLVSAQGVPSHIGSPTPGSGYEKGDPFSDFLPPPIPYDPNIFQLRAIVFVTETTKKGTARNGQEYVNPLLVMTGDKYFSMTFSDVFHAVCDALRGDQPRPAAVRVLKSGNLHVTYENGDSREVAPRAGP